MDYSDKLRLAQILHPNMNVEEAVEQLEAWLHEHEHDGVYDLAMTLRCPCGEQSMEMSVQDLLDNPDFKPYCKCNDAEWFTMQCGDCGHKYDVPEFQIETAKCPKCG
jgi:hypothetical protein